MAPRITIPASEVRPSAPPRAPSAEEQALLRRVRRLRVRTRLIAALGVILAAAGFAAVVAPSEGLSPLELLLPAGLAIALLAERRLARLSAADRRIRMAGMRDLTLTTALLAWGWTVHEAAATQAGGGGFDGGGGGADGDC